MQRDSRPPHTFRVSLLRPPPVQPASTLGMVSVRGCAVPWRAHQACRRREPGPAGCRGRGSSRLSLPARAQASAESAARLGGGLGGAGVAQDGLLQRLLGGRPAVPVPVAALPRRARARRRLVLRALLAPHMLARLAQQCSRVWSGGSVSSIPMPPSSANRVKKRVQAQQSGRYRQHLAALRRRTRAYHTQ